MRLIAFCSIGLLAILCTANATKAADITNVASEHAADSPLKAWRKPAADRQRRIIFNNDGNEPVTVIKGPSAQQILDARTTALVGSQVDSIFYCTWSSGFGLFTHFTKVGQVFTSREGRHEHNQMEALQNAGIDPLQVMVDFCKQHKIEIFWSLRMNDTHDRGKTDYGPIMFRANDLKNSHPEYLLSTSDHPPKNGGWSAVDYGQAEVRELAFRYVEEVCQNYDIDGVELDFFRHPVFFKSTSRGDSATEEECAQMTALLKRIRTMADEIGKGRGRPILIAVRTPDSVEYSRAIGLEIDNWMADDLVDLFIPSGYFQLNNWNYSVALGHKYGVKVYPSLDESRIRDEPAQLMRTSILAYRGRSAEAWTAGSDGIYLFNAFNPRSPLWRELGDPKTLAGLDKDYFASARGVINAAGGNLPYLKYQKIETLNPVNPKTIAAGQSATAQIYIGEPAEQLKRAKYRLRLQFKSVSDHDNVSIKLNGNQVGALTASGNWLEGHVDANALHTGANQVELSLREKEPNAIVWRDLVIEKRASRE